VLEYKLKFDFGGITRVFDIMHSNVYSK